MSATARLSKELEIYSVAAKTLAEHVPRFEGSDTLCACGMMFPALSGRAWHRHAASMVLNALDAIPELQLVMPE